MKNLLIYINPEKFNGKFSEYENLTKLQIDNSLELGWKKEDIMFVTNFPYFYRGVTSVVVPIDKGYAAKMDCSLKIIAILHLFSLGLIRKDLYWYHDLDAYQQEPITEEELELENVDAGFCDYGRIEKWQLGSFFFKETALHIFADIITAMEIDENGESKLNDEDAMVYLTKNNTNNINTKIRRLNGRYDFGMRRVDFCFEKAVKPLKVLHFHPNNPILNTLGIAMYGKNRINKPLMTQRLIFLFNKYGYS